MRSTKQASPFDSDEHHVTQTFKISRIDYFFTGNQKLKLAQTFYIKMKSHTHNIKTQIVKSH